MRKRTKLYQIVIVLLMFMLMLPSFAGAEGEMELFGRGGGGKGPGKDPKPPTEETGSLTIHKFAQEKGATKGTGDGTAGQTPEGEPLEGVKYTIKRTHKYNPDTNEWTPVSGTPLTLTTGPTGVITFPNLPVGRYSVKETGWPDHVQGDSTEYFVDIPMTSADGTTLNYDVHIYPKNELLRGKVTLTKYGEDNKTKLKGVKFDLYKKGSPDEKISGPHTTNNAGQIVVENLAYGDYYFVEVGTISNYLLNGEHVEFTINKKNRDVKVQLNNYKKPEVTKSVNKTEVGLNEVVTYTISVTLPKDIKKYSNFTIKDVLHPDLEYVTGSASEPTGVSFSATGQTLTWTTTPAQLTPGTLTLTFDAKVKDTATRDQWIPNEARIDYNNGYVSGGENSNIVKIKPKYGSLKVTKFKKGKNGKEDGLAGAHFELRDKDGNVIATGISGGNGVVQWTPSLNKLNYGEYELYETKAPNGYRKMSKPIKVTINDKNKDVHVKVENTLNGWDLPKTGGIGTMLFTFIGLTLMGASSLLLIRRRKGEIS